jgi:hypothetical protein
VYISPLYNVKGIFLSGVVHPEKDSFKSIKIMDRTLSDCDWSKTAVGTVMSKCRDQLTRRDGYYFLEVGTSKITVTEREMVQLLSELDTVYNLLLDNNKKEA